MAMPRLVFIILLFFSWPAFSEGPFSEGVHYTVESDKSSLKPQINEFFSYNCPHCFSLEPFMKAFLEDKPEDLRFSRIPVGFGRGSWERSVDYYVLALALGVAEDLHDETFQLIQGKKDPFTSAGDIEDFLKENGISEAEIDKAKESFAAKSLKKRFQNSLKKQQIQGVPTIIVNNRYKVNIGSISTAEDFKALLLYLANKDFDKS